MTSVKNEALLPLEDMTLPGAPDWFPLAWGWWASLAIALLVIVLVVLSIRRHKRRLAPKKTALNLIKKEKPAAALELVRQVSLCYYPREQIAHLTGKDWYAFLDSQITEPVFAANYEQWQSVLYSKQHIENSEELVNHCYQWVDQALPPKKRSR